MPASKRAAPANRLLVSLPPALRRRFLASCDPVTLDFAQVLCKAGDPARYVYFPVDCFISLVTALAGDERLEVGIVGDEGMLGTSLILGVKSVAQHSLVQGAGQALRMNAAVFTQYCEKNAALRQVMNRYVHVLMSQLAQTAACTRYHVVEARLARWLLLTRDRAHSDSFHITHEFLAYMLGVRRVGITEAASALHARKLINYRRGAIDILDGPGLEKASCGCYAQANAMYEQVLGPHRESAAKAARLKPPH